MYIIYINKTDLNFLHIQGGLSLFYYIYGKIWRKRHYVNRKWTYMFSFGERCVQQNEHHVFCRGCI